MNMNIHSPYSPTQLALLKKLATASLPNRVTERRYTHEDIRALADILTKRAAWNNWQDWKDWGSDLGRGALNVVGDGGWAWDTGQNAAGNLSGYGGMVGSILGSTGGAVAGTAAMPGVGTVGGGVAGGVAGGAAGRGLGYALGSGIDWLMGNKPGESQMRQVQNSDGSTTHAAPSFLNTTFDGKAMLGDAVFGLIPGAGKGLQTAWRGVAGAGKQAVKGHLAKSLGRDVSEKSVQNFMDRTGRWGTAKALARGESREQLARWGMQPYRAPQGANLLQRGLGRTQNFARNMGRTVTTKAGLKNLGREGFQLAKWGIPLSAAGSALAQTAPRAGSQTNYNPFTNTQGFTQVVGNKNRGLSGVKAMSQEAYSPV